MDGLSLLDRAIGYVSQRALHSRLTMRAFNEATQSAISMVYDGATRSFRTAGRRIGSTSANTEIMMSLGRLRDVSRDLRRNNPLATNAVTVIDSHVVGAGIVPTLDNGTPARLKKAVENLIKVHLETTDIDVEGRNNYYGLQSLITKTAVDSGEALVVRYFPEPKLRLTVPMQVKVIEPDYLDASIDGPLANGNIAFQGIEVEPNGRRVAYHLYDHHPGGGLTWTMPRSRRVPAEDVIHVYRMDRPGQMRGIPWCAPVVMTLWDTAEYEDADLVRQKIAACFAIFLEGATPETNVAQRATGNRARGSVNPITKLNPGLIQTLPGGVKPHMTSPPTVVGQADFLRIKGHRVAAGYGVPYEMISTDNSDVSFISGRLGHINFNKNVDQWRWHMLIPHACDGIMRWFLEGCAIALSESPAKLRRVAVSHTPPRREMIDPSTEIPAMRDAVRAGFSSRSAETRSLGVDPLAIDRENAEDNARADKDGLSYDSDGRRPLLLKQNIDPGDANNGVKPGEGKSNGG